MQTIEKETRQVGETGQSLEIGGRWTIFLNTPCHHFSLSPCPGEHLQICPQEYTCCSSETEQKLIRETEATFRGLVEDSGSFLVHTLAARHRKFNGEDSESPKTLHTSFLC